MPCVGALLAPRLGCWNVADVDPPPPPPPPPEPPPLGGGGGGDETTTGCDDGVELLTGAGVLDCVDVVAAGALATVTGAGAGFGLGFGL
jgi:hypothetical protein